MPAAPCSRVTSRLHHNVKSSHFGALKTTKLVSQDFHWSAMESDIRKYIGGCKMCHRIEAPRHGCYGLNMPLPPRIHPWKGLTMDLVTDLPVSMASGYTGILVFVDCLTEMATDLPCRRDIYSPELAQMLFQHVIY